MAPQSSDGAGRIPSGLTSTAAQAQAQGILGGKEDTADILTPLEQDLLEEYERLADNMKKLAALLDTLAGAPTAEILRGLELLERKTSLVFTLLKASVYSIVLQQEIYSGDQAGGNGTGGGGGGLEG